MFPSAPVYGNYTGLGKRSSLGYDADMHQKATMTAFPSYLMVREISSEATTM
jgi:hypothetical protein